MILVADYAAMMPSKGDEHVYALSMGFHMPPLMYCSRAYCRSVILGQQACPRTENIKRANLKKYEDASIHNFFVELVKELDEKAVVA